MSNVINLPKTENESNKALAVRIVVHCFDPKNSPLELPNVLRRVKDALDEFDAEDAKKTASQKSVDNIVPFNKDRNLVAETVFDDYLVCLEDGEKVKSLKRYLRARYNISFKEYKEKWRLPFDYPSTCPSYSKIRSNIAKDIGLGGSKNKAQKELQMCPDTPHMFEDIPAPVMVTKKVKLVAIPKDNLDL